MIVSIAEDYTQTPGGRYMDEGPYSGEDFRDNFLDAKYKECIETQKKLIINFDGGYGYAPGFLEECFGGLVRKGYDGRKMLNTMIFISNEEPELIDEVIGYITSAMEIQINCTRKSNNQKVLYRDNNS